MDIFQMSDRLIDKSDIDFEQLIYYLPPNFSKRLESSVVHSSIWTLDTYYDYRKIPAKVGYQNSVLIREIIKNSRGHGGSKDFPTYFGLFINKDRFCMGINDGGGISKERT
jgi:hypothetical protein